MSRITWVVEKYKKGITAFNDKGEDLGWLEKKMIGRHYHWVWFQETDVFMSPSCLDEVRAKMKEKFHQRKNL